MRHLGIITTSFPSGVPGSEAAGSFVHDFAQEISKHVKVTLFAPDYKNCHETMGNISIYRYAVPKLPLSILNPINPFQWSAIIKTLKSGYKITSNVVLNGKIDHILALWAIPSGYWAMKLKDAYGISYSVWALGSDIWSMRDKPIVGSLLNKILATADQRFADGLQLARDVGDICGYDCMFMPSSRIFGGERPINKNTAPPYNLAYLGRWHRNKGIDILLESLRDLSDQEWDLIREVRIYGGGPLEVHVNDAVTALHENNRPVTLGGYISKEEAIKLLDWADYLLIPSRIESIPVVFSDAMQSGTPVIASPTGDLPELLRDRKCGILADAISAKAFSKAIRMALSGNPNEYYDGITDIKNSFDIKSTVINYLAAIEK